MIVKFFMGKDYLEIDIFYNLKWNKNKIQNEIENYIGKGW